VHGASAFAIGGTSSVDRSTAVKTTLVCGVGDGVAAGVVRAAVGLAWLTPPPPHAAKVSAAIKPMDMRFMPFLLGVKERTSERPERMRHARIDAGL